MPAVEVIGPITASPPCGSQNKKAGIRIIVKLWSDRLPTSSSVSQRALQIRSMESSRQQRALAEVTSVAATAPVTLSQSFPLT